MGLCKSPGCSIHASFGEKGSARAEFCFQHKSTDMVGVTGKMCAYRGCPKRSWYGTEGSRKAVFCNEHKEAGMINVRCKRCAYDGCFASSSFGRKGSKKPEFCSQHKQNGMVEVYRKRCAYDGCYAQPCFGSEGSRNAEFCSQHKPSGMVNVCTRQCAYDGCHTKPCFGSKGSQKAEYCGEHKRSGMVNVRSRQCAYHGCSVRPAFAKMGSKKEEMCRRHKTLGMVNVKMKRCVSKDCAKQAARGLDGSTRKLVLCRRHFTEMGRAEASAGNSADARVVDDANGVKTAEHVSMSSSRKGEERVERPPGKVQQISGIAGCGGSKRKRMRILESETTDLSQDAHKESTPVRGSSSTPSLPELTPLVSLHIGDQPRELHVRHRDDRAKSRERRKSTRSGCGREVAHVLRPESCVNAAKLGKSIPAELVERTDTAGIDLTNSPRTGAEEGALSCVGGNEVKTGNGEAFVASNCAGAVIDVSTTSTQVDCHASASSAFVLEDQQKLPSLEKERKETAYKVKNLQDIVEQLTKQVADAAVDRARAVAEATIKAEDKMSKNVQGLRCELAAASNRLKDNANTYVAVCDERQGLRQQLTKVQAQLASATSKIKEASVKTEIAKETFQQRIKALNLELNAASIGWESSKEDVKKIGQERETLQTAVQNALLEGRRQCEDVKKIREERDALKKEVEQTVLEKRRQREDANKIRQERDALHKELEAQVALQVAFHADNTSKAAAHLKIIADRLKSVNGGLGTAIQTGDIVGTTAPGPAVSVSPAALVAATPAAQYSGRSPASELTTLAAQEASSNELDGAIRGGDAVDGFVLCRLKNEVVRAEVVRLPGCLDMSMVAIKPEERKAQQS